MVYITIWNTTSLDFKGWRNELLERLEKQRRAFKKEYRCGPIGNHEVSVSDSLDVFGGEKYTFIRDEFSKR